MEGLPVFETEREEIDFIVKNKEILVAQKKAEIKCADCFCSAPLIVRGKDLAAKANDPVNIDSLNKLKVLVIVNTSNLLDQHSDVHIPGLWKKSLKENKMIMHLQEHAMRFEKIISDGDNLKAFTRNYMWSELGLDFEGSTEALTFESTIYRKRNEFMFLQYANGYVKNHSVGMRYVQLVLCVNDDQYGAQFEAWEKYFPMVANHEAAVENGYFWAVKEAKIVEGSAVPLGSNWITPTLENNAKTKPPEGTSKIIEPSNDTQKRNYLLNLLKN